jgi:chorismate mutase
MMMMVRFQLLIIVLIVSTTVRDRMATAENAYTLDTVREALVRQEDTIVFGLIERAKFPFNSQTYDQKFLEIPGFCGSLIEFVVKDTEIVQAKVNNYGLFELIYLSLFTGISTSETRAYRN